MHQTTPPPAPDLSIPEIAVFLGLHISAVEQTSQRYNWQPTGERIQGGGDKYNIDTIRFYKSDKNDSEARLKIKNKIRDNKNKIREEADRAAFAAKLARIKEEMRRDDVDRAEEPLSLEDRETLLWAPLKKMPAKRIDKGFEKQIAVARYKRLQEEGMSEREAAETVASEMDRTPGCIRQWEVKTRGLHPGDHVTVLVRQPGGGRQEFPSGAWWEYFKTDFLRKGKGKKPPSIASCYRRLEAAATQNGWTIPTLKTVGNWINKLDPMVVLFRREGMKAVERRYPSQQRNKEMFDVLQAINGDGVELPIYADFGNGIVVKPIAWLWQCIRSSKITAWRLDISENQELIRLTLLDHITEYGLPEFASTDNTTAAASKQITGGVKNRYRWKVKATDPLGVMVLLGIEHKPTLPGHGQSKPIERVNGTGGIMDFGNLPVFEGRGTKGRPVPIAEVEEHFKHFINEINARPDRRGDAVQGKSFDQVFNELLPLATITKVTEKQRKYCMLVAEVATVNRTDGSVTLRAGKSDIGSNRYWNEALTRYMGEKVAVRFDPADMHCGVYVETLTGDEICFAEPTATGGFKDADAARKHARNKGHFKKHIKLAAEAEGRMTADLARQYMITPPEPEKPTAAKVTRIAANVPSKGKAAAVAVDQPETAEVTPLHDPLKLFAQASKKVDMPEFTPEQVQEMWQKGAAMRCQELKKAV